ncbi:hypothetical protein LCGC14_2524970 [marine sediment metagenome]|uniref:Uncharacterized protein n=1 Tax=marine sediment metagenome TaxID=412755 RepID=A0A0F9D6T6_9ZZZZ
MTDQLTDDAFEYPCITCGLLPHECRCPSLGQEDGGTTPADKPDQANAVDPGVILTVDDLLPKLRLNVCTLVEAGQIATAVEALQDICAGHEIDLKNSGSDNDDLRLEKEATEARVVELAGALEQVRQCCLFSDDDAGPIGVTTDPHIDEQLFKDICTALATTPAEALERASAKDAALKGIIVAWEHPPGGRRYSPREIEDWLHNNMKPAIDAVRALAKLDVLGREEKEDV